MFPPFAFENPDCKRYGENEPYPKQRGEWDLQWRIELSHLNLHVPPSVFSENRRVKLVILCGRITYQVGDQRKFKFAIALFLAAFVGILSSGCTSFPVYERTIVRIYDADMNLKKICVSVCKKSLCYSTCVYSFFYHKTKNKEITRWPIVVVVVV